MDKLTPTTKELIYERIEKLKSQIDSLKHCLTRSPNNDFCEFWDISIELHENEIEKLKQLLFNN